MFKRVCFFKSSKQKNIFQSFKDNKKLLNFSSKILTYFLFLEINFVRTCENISKHFERFSKMIKKNREDFKQKSFHFAILKHIK